KHLGGGRREHQIPQPVLARSHSDHRRGSVSRAGNRGHTAKYPRKVLQDAVIRARIYVQSTSRV
ncbi:hypothetical protein LTR29_018259, partial [Friedmanniomyces endolithicus]